MINCEINFYLTPTFNKYPLYIVMCTDFVEIKFTLLDLKFCDKNAMNFGPPKNNTSS